MDGTLDIALPESGTLAGSDRRRELFLLAACGAVGAALVVSVAARLALRPSVVPPTRWFGFLDPVPLDRPSLLPLVMIFGVGLLVGSWLRLCQRGHAGRTTTRQVA
nr:hypothetical protein [Micromonospora sp. DSM 115978]